MVFKMAKLCHAFTLKYLLSRDERMEGNILYGSGPTWRLSKNSCCHNGDFTKATQSGWRLSKWLLSEWQLHYNSDCYDSDFTVNFKMRHTVFSLRHKGGGAHWREALKWRGALIKGNRNPQIKDKVLKYKWL